MSNSNSSTSGPRAPSSLRDNPPAPLSHSPSASLSPSSENRSPQPRNTPSSPMTHHRQSWSQDLRGVPPSPHRQRHASMNQQAVQELLSNPPVAHRGEGVFANRDWKTITVGEVVDPEEVRFAEVDTSVEEATNILIAGGPPNVVLIRQNKNSHVAVNTFDYSDLNAYLLLVIGLARPSEVNAAMYAELLNKARAGRPIPVNDINQLGHKESIVTLPQSASLTKAVEVFGSGVHRILLTREDSHEVSGVLTQLRMVRFFWENGRNFPAIETLFGNSLHDLAIGGRTVKSINGDKPLSDALELMHNESITSLPVLDNQRNVVGNISHVDVRLLTKSTSVPLLKSSCIHFISIILSERGMDDGKDSFPVFYVSPYSTLAHTIAKLVATRSHRMWIVDAPSPSSSVPQTPTMAPTSTFSPLPLTSAATMTGNSAASGMPNAGTAVSASSLPGQHMSGRLSGVVSLTDVLNLFARATGLSPQDPNDARRRRRGSSSSSLRASIDSNRSSSVDLSRSGSLSNSRTLPNR